MNNKNKSELNIFTSLLYQFIALIFGLLVPRITMLSYGSSINGLLSSALQFVGYLSLFEAGIQAVATKSLYRTVAVNDIAGTNSILSAVNISYKKTGVCYFIGLVCLSSIFPIFIKENINYSTIFFVVFFSGLSNVVLFFFQAKYRILLQVEGKNYFINIINVITNISNHIIKIILLHFKVNIAFVVLGSFLISLIPASIIMMYIKKFYTWVNLKETPDFSALVQNKDAIVHQISWMVFTNTDTLILTVFCDLKVVSVYVIYKMINDYILSFSKIPFESVSFRLGQLFYSDKEKFKQYINCVELFTSAVCFILFTVTLCLTTSFITLYTHNVNDIDYVDEKLAILFVVVQLLSYMRMPMLNTISYAGHFKQTLIPTIIETGINIIASLVGVVYLGIYGVLLGTIAALVYRTIDVIIYANKKLLDRGSLRTFSYYLMDAVLIFGIYRLFVHLPVSITSYWEFFMAGIILTVIVSFLYLVTACLVYKKEFTFLRLTILKELF